MRNQNLPIAKLDSTRSAAKIESMVKLMLMNEGPLMVIATDYGEVFAISPNELRATATLEQRPDWIVGVYNKRFGAGNMARDLRERQMELSEALA